MSTSPFVLPPYPYDRLGEIDRIASKHEGGAVDLSIGTPCDPPPFQVVEALAASGAERGYPASVGTSELRQAAAGWMSRRLGVHMDPSHIAACVGTKEFVASLPLYLRLRRPERDTILHPQIAYPTYAMGAELSGCRAVGVPERPGGGLDLDSIDEEDAERALALWLNTPSNPSGLLTDLEEVADWGRRRGIPVISDECYIEFTWERGPETILSGGAEGVLALHSLSKRSNLAGCRVGFYAGDPELVHFLSEVRKHAGLMPPGPEQHAGAVALGDDAHVDAQRAVYLRRLEQMSAVLESAGLEAPLPAGAFYLWIPVPDWALEMASHEAGST
ncbi:MAG: aminotransferase class I/II-fold pyridoxal phosphate-dependent enzyme, partial [Acidimicrobiales bacterium]